mmetsp:Transcript_36014/g.90677  ORF Transcript_36014/g.90677 Transcript_36014/m.90677 type:complete len:394 (+) Transcript_36014:38-1219(+)
MSRLACTVVQAGCELGCRARLVVIVVIVDPLISLLPLSKHLLVSMPASDAVLYHACQPSDFDLAAAIQHTPQHQLRKGSHHHPLQEPLQGPSSHGRSVGAANEERGCGVVHLDGDLSLFEALDVCGKLQTENASELWLREGREHGNLVDAVEELGREHLLDHTHHRLLCILAHNSSRNPPPEQMLRTNIRSKNDDRVLEVHYTALSVGEAPIVHHLQQRVPHLGMRLLDLVTEHHAVRPPPDSLSQLPPLIVPHVARGRSDEAVDGVSLQVLRHVEAHQHLVVVEELASEGTCSLCLANTGWAQEEEASRRTVGRGKASPAAHDGVGNGRNGPLLPDDLGVEALTQVQNLLLLTLSQPVDGNTRPSCNNLCNLIRADNLREQPVFVLLILLHE